MKGEYVFRVVADEKGLNFSGECKGFNAFEVLGFLQQKAFDVSRQIQSLEDKGKINFERIVITEKIKDPK